MNIMIIQTFFFFYISMFVNTALSVCRCVFVSRHASRMGFTTEN